MKSILSLSRGSEFQLHRQLQDQLAEEWRVTCTKENHPPYKRASISFSLDAAQHHWNLCDRDAHNGLHDAIIAELAS